MWKDKQQAQEHYDDLVKVREHVLEGFKIQKESGALVDKAAHENRLKRIDAMIKIADEERKSTKEGENNPGIK